MRSVECGLLRVVSEELFRGVGHACCYTVPVVSQLTFSCICLILLVVLGLKPTCWDSGPDSKYSVRFHLRTVSDQLVNPSRRSLRAVFSPSVSCGFWPPPPKPNKQPHCLHARVCRLCPCPALKVCLLCSSSLCSRLQEKGFCGLTRSGKGLAV